MSKQNTKKKIVKKSLKKSEKTLKEKTHKKKTHKEKDHKEKDHKEKDHKEKDHKEKDHKEKDHKEKDHKEKDHKENKHLKKIDNKVISLSELREKLEDGNKLTTNDIQFIEFGLEDLKNAFENACQQLGGEIVNNKCRIDIQNTIKSMVTIIEISEPENIIARKHQQRFLNNWRRGVVKMLGGGLVGCQSTGCANNTRLVYDSQGTIHCDAPKYRGGQEMHYLLGEKHN